MESLTTVLEAVRPDLVAAISRVVVTQAVLVVGLIALVGFRYTHSDAKVEAALDRLLARESDALRRRARDNPLDFRTSEFVRPDLSTVGWGLYPGKVEVVRTIRAAIDSGYRVRLRAYARGLRGRVIVRSIEVELRRGA